MLESSEKNVEMQDKEVQIVTKRVQEPAVLENCPKKDERTVSDYDTSQFYSGSEGESEIVSEAGSYKEITGYLYDV